MQLSSVFDACKNLGKLAPEWWKHLQQEMAIHEVTTTVKTVAEQAASLIAPAALIATIAKSGQVDLGTSVRVLVLGRDPSFRLDNGRWLSYGGDFIGGIESFEALTLIDEQTTTSFGTVAEGVGRRAATVVTEAQIQAGEYGAIDFAIWVHPVAEIADEHTALYSRLVARLDTQGVPIFSCHFNELDHISQSVLVNELGFEFRLLPGQDAKARPLYFNRYGIGLKGTGVRGGWGAMLTQLVRQAPEAPRRSPIEVAAVRAALALLRAEGGGYSKWVLGDTLGAVPGGSSRLMGLLGDMAVDTQIGRVFHLDETGNTLLQIGHCWSVLLAERPDNLADLTVWASRLYLTFALGFPPAKNDREIYEQALRAAMDAGVCEASIGLARCLEATALEQEVKEADALYRANAGTSPMAAYYVAHADMDKDIRQVADHLHWASEQGYPNAMHDLAQLCAEAEGGQQISRSLLERAAAMGDTMAILQVAELALKEGQPEEAKRLLKTAIEVFELPCAEFYLKIVEQQFKHGLTDLARIKRERSWVLERIKRMKKHALARV